MTSSQYEHRIRYELEHVWILNLSMHFRDKSRREKFFVTYRQRPDLTRRVTISLDYRDAPEGSLEMDLLDTKLQRDKNEMIYEAIRESLVDIQFYNTVTNLKLQTTDGRLHVHVVEDTTEIIDYPSVQFVHHLGCRKIRESEVGFDSHMSGFVYKVRVDGRVLIKKEIPGPDSVDEFLYEVNALNFLRDSQNVIELYGIIIGDDDRVRGLLISYAEQGALIDILYENNHGIPWYTRMKWARQIVHGLSEIHEAGFVQGDFTLSNIVIDDDGNAKIIDINRRGCPVGWEPPEATPLIQSDQRISMYIGVKSDLYQLGMVLWALATQEDDPEAHGRPLHLGEDVGVPQWYRSIVETCLAEDPRERSQALQLLSYFPRLNGGSARFDDSDYEDDWVHGPHHHPTFYAHSAPSGSVDDGSNSFRHRAAGIDSVPSGDDNADDDIAKQFMETERPEFVVDKFTNLTPIIRSVTPGNDWAYVNNFGHTYVDPTNGVSNEPYYYPTRGRSPPRKGTSSARRDASWVRQRSLSPEEHQTWAQTSATDLHHEMRSECSPHPSPPANGPPASIEVKHDEVHDELQVVAEVESGAGAETEAVAAATATATAEVAADDKADVLADVIEAEAMETAGLHIVAPGNEEVPDETVVATPVIDEVVGAVSATDEGDVSTPVAKEAAIAEPIVDDVAVATPVDDGEAVSASAVDEVGVSTPVVEEVVVAAPVLNGVAATTPVDEVATPIVEGAPVDDNGAVHIHLLENEARPPVEEASNLDNADAESKDVTAPSSPERSGESHYSLANGARTLETAPLEATTDTPKNDTDNKLLDQIKGACAVYEEEYPRHINLEHDEKKIALDDQPHDRVDDGLNSLVTT
ncbi:hypothetical protein Sste5346_001014 [Sporothrix stenoceras]|uniref:Protein kinase domain-containing protein n=1 Tax=Sporothrix stenoceras TaxID=5173 RepID=A0ABR3ZQP6_9PEZI